MRIDILTTFPEMFAGVFGSSILKRACDKGIIEYILKNTNLTESHGRSMFSGFNSQSSGFNSYKVYLFIINVICKHTN